jgi:hypothetical protein
MPTKTATRVSLKAGASDESVVGEPIADAPISKEYSTMAECLNSYGANEGLGAWLQALGAYLVHTCTCIWTSPLLSEADVIHPYTRDSSLLMAHIKVTMSQPCLTPQQPEKFPR